MLTASSTTHVLNSAGLNQKQDNHMRTKQFISILVLLVAVAVLYVYDNTAAITSRSKCADYAMSLAVQSFPDAFEATGETFPPKLLKAEASQGAQANYELFYDFCLNKRGVAGQ